ncbi:NACHT domain-containing protein [Azospirillum argentinense]|uniref:NACHT domain-containing protein n=1 Tax=Azospirillum argentinense TaxID=2970906 RepID=A0A5B0KII6_9PROT|nr:NACHT domain-containing protein [Azospirillum argentinense]KAA1052427.1 hypothetical protein FH063_004306 [Azospirillum argentinense]
MSNPFDPLAITASIAANLATSVLTVHAGKLEGTLIGKALRKAGILKPNFHERLQESLKASILRFSERYPAHSNKIFIQFLESPAMSGAIREYILSNKPYDVTELREHFADQLDVPPRTPDVIWPYGVNPTSAILAFFQEIDRGFALSADEDVLWISRQNAQISQKVDATLESVLNLAEQLSADKNREYKDFSRRYNDHLRNRCNNLSTPGVRQLRDVNQSLSIAYISVNLLAKNGATAESAESILFHNPYIVVRGPAGSGKTTLIHWITLQCAKEPSPENPWAGRVPFIIPLRKVARLETGAPKITRFVEYSVDELLWEHEAPKGWLTNVLEQKNAVIMIDGVDEFPPSKRTAFWDWLAGFAKDHAGNRIIVTSRTIPGTMGGESSAVLEQWNPPPGFIDAEVQEMSTDDITRFIHHWHDAIDEAFLTENDLKDLKKARSDLPGKLADPANRRIRELCGTPLLCAMVCVLHWREEGYLPTQKVDLYAQCCDMLIEARDIKRRIEPPAEPLSFMTKNDKEMVLQRLAFEMMTNNLGAEGLLQSDYRIEIEKSKAIEWINRYAPSFQRAEARSCTGKQIIDFLLERTGLIREPSGGLIDFPHRSFQEYLAASAAGADKQEAFLANQAENDQWHETIMLAAGTPTGGVAFGKSLIEALLRRGERNKSARSKSQKVRKTCFALALGSLENLRQHDQELRDRVLKHLGELVPPHSQEDAKILAVAGDAAVPYLGYVDWKDERTATVAACAHALRLIGSSLAAKALRLGYLEESRDAVVSEVVQAHGIEVSEIPYVKGFVEQFSRLPSFATVRSIHSLFPLDNLRSVRVSSPLPDDIELMCRLRQITDVAFEKVDLSSVAHVTLPEGIVGLMLSSTYGDPHNVIDKVPQLKSLTIIDADGSAVEARAFLPKTLESATLSGMPNLETLMCLDGQQKIAYLRIAGNRNLKDISSIAGLQSLKSISIRSCPEVMDVSHIACAPNLSTLELIDCWMLKDLSPISGAKSLRSLTASELFDAHGFPAIGELKNLEELNISYCPNLAGMDWSESLQVLRSLSIVDGSNIESLSSLRNITSLKSLKLAGFPEIADLESVCGSKDLEEVALHAFPRIRSIDALSNFERLLSISLGGCPKIGKLPDLSKLSRLRKVEISDCGSLTDLDALRVASELEEVRLARLPGISDISALAEIGNLKKVGIFACPEVTDLSPLERLDGLELIEISGGDQPRLRVPEKLMPLIRRRGPYDMPIAHYEPHGIVRVFDGSANEFFWQARYHRYPMRVYYEESMRRVYRARARTAEQLGL